MSLPEDWKDQAVCATVDPELFFPPRSNDSYRAIKAAKAICACCPVVGDCLAYAMSSGEPYGIWGGMDECEREQLTGTRKRY